MFDCENVTGNTQAGMCVRIYLLSTRNTCYVVHLFISVLQSWDGHNHVMCGVLDASYLNFTRDTLCFRYVDHPDCIVMHIHYVVGMLITQIV